MPGNSKRMVALIDGIFAFLVFDCMQKSHKNRYAQVGRVVLEVAYLSCWLIPAVKWTSRERAKSVTSVLFQRFICRMCRGTTTIAPYALVYVLVCLPFLSPLIVPSLPLLASGKIPPQRHVSSME